MRLPLKAQLKLLTEACTVEIPRAGINGGSGFFIAPGLVVTSAHVVARADNRVTEDRVAIRWQREMLYGHPRAEPDSSDNSQIWPFPDLCVIELDDAPLDQPWVLLDESLSSDSPDVYLAGYGAIYDDVAVPQFQGRQGRLDGPYEARGGRFWQIAGCEITAGMSGAPVLDLSSAAVCAVVKTQRSSDGATGGLAVPVGAIREFFPDSWDRSQRAERQLGRWTAIRTTLQAMSNQLGETLGPSELYALSQADNHFRLSRSQLNRLWYEIAGDRVPLPRQFGNVLDLAAALMNRPTDGLDPLARLFGSLANWEESEESTLRLTLRDSARAVAQRNGQLSELETYRPVANQASPSPVPVIVIRLDRYPLNPKQFTFTAWRYQDKTSPATWINEFGPYSMKGLQQAVADLLAEQIPLLSRDEGPLIEFALPDDLLDHPVEDWIMEKVKLKIEYPVVIRFAHLPADMARKSRAKAARFGDYRLPPPDDQQAWRELWVSCREMRFDDLVGQFIVGSRSPVLAMTAWQRNKGGVPTAVLAAKRAGIWIIFWQHRQCLGDQFSSPCRCVLFQEAVVKHFAGITLDEIPIKAWELRQYMAVKVDGSPGDQMAILWDDPNRAQWRYPLQAREPAEQPG